MPRLPAAAGRPPGTRLVCNHSVRYWLPSVSGDARVAADASPGIASSGDVWFRLDRPGQPGRRGPDQGARPGLLQTPGGRTLHPVIVAASTGNVAGASESALIIGDRVIKVAPGRWSAADREPAVLVADLDEVPHPVGDPVSGGSVGVCAGGNVIAVHVVLVQATTLAGRRCGGRQDGPQSGNQPRRRA